MNRFSKRLILTGIFFACIALTLIFSNHSLTSSSTVLQVSRVSSSFSDQTSPIIFQADSPTIFAISFSWVDDLFRILRSLFVILKRLLELNPIDDLLRLLKIPNDDLLGLLKISNILMAVIAAILITIINAPLIICVWLWRLTQPQITKLSLSIYKVLKQPNTYHLYTGEILLPIKSYEGDSHSVSVQIKSFSSKVIMPEKFNQSQENNSFIFVQERNILSEEIEQQLEITLSTGSSITVEGDKKQIRDLKSSLSYSWICNFTASSNQEVSFKFNLLPTIKHEENDIKPQIESSEIGYINRRVTIAKFLSFTKNQIAQAQIFLILANILIGVKTIPGLLSELPKIAKALGGG
jgi:hypothetical protein